MSLRFRVEGNTVSDFTVLLVLLWLVSAKGI